jgi:hypothetical protein
MVYAYRFFFIHSLAEEWLHCEQCCGEYDSEMSLNIVASYPLDTYHPIVKLLYHMAIIIFCGNSTLCPVVTVYLHSPNIVQGFPYFTYLLVLGKDFLFVLFYETESCYVAQAGLMILLSVN